MRRLLPATIVALLAAQAPGKDATSPAARLDGLLRKGFEAEAPFIEIEAAATRLSDKELQVLVAQLRPLGTEGNAGWVRSAVFAEWGRRSPKSALKWIENPPGEEPPWQSRSWVKRQQFIAVFRGWAEVDPDGALETMNTEVHDPFRQERAHLEIFRCLAKRDGLDAWDRIPEDGARGGAIQGVFRGLSDPRERLQAVLRWMPELDSKGPFGIRSPLGYRMGPKMSEYVRLHSFNVHASSQFVTDAAVALAELDLPMAVDWLRTKFSPRSVKPLLQKWAALYPDRAQRELVTGRYASTDLITGILSGDPTRAPVLINRIKDDPRRAAALKRVIEQADGEGYRHYYPSPNSRVLRQQDPKNYDALVEAITVGAFDPKTVHNLERSLRSEFHRYVKPDGTLR